MLSFRYRPVIIDILSIIYGGIKRNHTIDFMVDENQVISKFTFLLTTVFYSKLKIFHYRKPSEPEKEQQADIYFKLDEKLKTVLFNLQTVCLSGNTCFFFALL